MKSLKEMEMGISVTLRVGQMSVTLEVDKSGTDVPRLEPCKEQKYIDVKGKSR